MSELPSATGQILDPDVSEEENFSDLDGGIPSQGYHKTRVVGLGGSAGGIHALQRFFQAAPPASGMAFVVVMHLSPDHESTLSDILQRSTQMPVKQVSGGERVQPNCVYVIPPAKHLTMTNGHLRVTDLPHVPGQRMTVDLFFRSLADTHGPHSVAVVLSGGDGDGAVGIKRIKERGGLTIAQDPTSAEHASMPNAAIATGMVDWVLKIEDVPAQVIAYHSRERRLELPPEQGPNPAAVEPPTASENESALRDVLKFVRARTGRDFSHYKRATIVRRIARRMQVNEVDSVQQYLTFLRTHPGEANALLKDLLISVTNFFRDRQAFDALDHIIPQLFRDKAESDTVRVWVPACATGEEAYSIAMLLSEHAQMLDDPPAVQVFATDLDDDALAEARNGSYPAAISTDVSPERLRRFFVRERQGYRVRRELRELLLFAVHDLLVDSPFSRLDLISCRNLLIYLDRKAQHRALDIFHFALHNEGRLFLGTSESVDEDSLLFHPIDKKHRIYGVRANLRVPPPLPSGSPSLTRGLTIQLPEPSSSQSKRAGSTELLQEPASTQDRPSWATLHLKLLERFGSPSLIVNHDHDIVHLTQSAAPFLRFAGGEPSTNLLHAVHPALRAELRAALYRAQQTGQNAVALGIALEIEREARLVDVTVSPAGELAPDFLLVSFALQAGRPDGLPPAVQDEPVIQHLERALDQTKRNLRDVVEQNEASTEELKASNEELQAMNEELRSATEELETSREELQSINEEVTAVNQELKSKLDELGSANSDLHNLMGAMAIATVFLDRQLRIMRFTPPTEALFSVIPSDMGRPLGDFQHRLQYPQMLADAARVLQHLATVEREVSDDDGHYFLARVLPYRTTDDHIAGVVLTFVDITERQLAKEAVLRAHDELEQRVKERTAQLDELNAALQSEVEGHQRAENARQQLQRRFVTAQEEERGRISRELHDEVGQQITALMLSMKALESSDDSQGTSAKLSQLRLDAELIAREIHQLATQLRPVALDQLGLARALAGLLDGWMTRTGIEVDFLSAGIEDARLPSQIETTLYRIVQEAMNNVLKHAAATSVSVSVERRGDYVLAIVEDNGQGFEPDAAQGGEPQRRIGIAGMRERASIVGGELTIESGPNQGTTVRVRVPIPAS